MKVKPLIDSVHNYKDIACRLVHTGQHNSKSMLDDILNDLGIPEPGFFPDVAGGSKADVVAKVVQKYDALLTESKPDYVVVFGDVSSTLAAAIVAKYNDVKLVHVESGLRSFDRNMPEEINRILVDQLADLHFITEESARENLLREGVDSNKIFLVGNVMIDTLILMQDQIDTATVLSRLHIKSLDYFFLTMHRPSNVDCSIKLRKMCEGIVKLSEKITIIFAVHPRTRSFMEKYDLLYMLNDCDRVILLDPLGYIDMQAVMKYAKAVITDSGGLQEESTYLQIPCLTIRDNTERPVTIDVGSNTLVGDDWTMINKLADEILSGSYKQSVIPDLWDGLVSRRILEIIKQKFLGANAVKIAEKIG